jgi:hypothetical protein
MDNGDSFPGQKRAERKTNYLPNSLMMLKFGGTMLTVLTRLCGVQRHKFIFKLKRRKNVLHSVHFGISG